MPLTIKASIDYLNITPPNTIFMCNIITFLFFYQNQTFSWSLKQKKKKKKKAN